MVAPHTLSEGLIAVFLMALALSAGAIGLLLATNAAGRIATDLPNDRSLHARPVPRVGGWGVVPAALAAAIVFDAANMLLVCIVAVLFAVSYVDDRYGLPILARISVHALAAALWLWQGPVQLPPAIAILAGCAILWITNLFNFMDGSDGLAGGMAIFAFTTFGAVASTAGIAPLAVWSIAVAGAVAGFLFFNLDPAVVFLGDAGSISLGFLAGVFGLWGWAAGAWPLWFPFLVAAPFVLDATVTLLRRVFRREPFWRAHREHYYQRLIRMGWTHRRTALLEYVLMAGCSGLAIWMLSWRESAQMIGLACAAAAFVILAHAIDRRWAAFLAKEARRAAEAPRVTAAAASASAQDCMSSSRRSNESWKSRTPSA
jgi:UDP-N-acetylmuramyl pentapeptide phosphotransferase/UDP-N-acetylglucosamine-1-phosphate transferase